MIEDKELIMLRNVHPHFLNNGRVGSGGFVPSAEHEYQLSLDDSSLSSPKKSRERHETTFGLASAGVFGVAVAEFETYSIECNSDPIPNNDAHVLADFDLVKEVSTKNLRNTGRKLAAIATQRGQLD